MLHIYLDMNALLEAGATFSDERASGGKSYRLLHFGNRSISLTDGASPYLPEGDLNAEVYADLREFVTEVSYYDNFGGPRRQIGHYRLASATASLEMIGGQGNHYHLKIRAKSLPELRELYQLIRQGQIWPVLDYETEQVPPPFLHLRDLIGQMWKLIRRDIRDRLYRIRERVTR